MKAKEEKVIKKPTLLLALATMIGSIVFILVGTVVFKGSLALLFIIAWLIVLGIGLYLGHKYKDLEDSAIEMMKSALQPCMIMFVVGGMIATLIASGTVPAIIYYGLKIINPQIFLPVTMVLCFFTAMVAGTSWGTIGTTGLAMVGVGMGMGMNPGVVAGAVVSGAFFGSKMSPLSDCTIVASAVVKIPLMTHIKHMLPTAIPGFVLAIIFYTVYGFRYVSADLDYTKIDSVIASMGKNFNMGFVPFIPIIILLILLFFKKPSLTSILIGGLSGIVVAILYQGQTLNFMLKAMYDGFTIESGDKFLDTILNRGGVLSMSDTVIVMLAAFGYSGILRKAGILDAIIEPLTAKIKSVFGLTVTTLVVVLCFLFTGGTMTFSSVMTGTLLLPVYRKWRLKPENLSRAFEDFSSMLGPTVPYGVNALYVSSMFGIAPLVFLPFCFLNFLIPITNLIFAFFGINMTKYRDDEEIPID